ncbi:hypothetical protein Daesc_003372 [Daldinia eschscholtzii]|uniref:Uncharacterized protein n=1 Tax=Daldinia eschscholtzii TaxID=292717 RepID=A0AAX6MSY2_9PEZI
MYALKWVLCSLTQMPLEDLVEAILSQKQRLDFQGSMEALSECGRHVPITPAVDESGGEP